MKKKWQKYIVLYILIINPPFSCSQNPLLRLELLNDPERWEKQKRKQTNKQTNSQKKKKNNNKKKEELMLAVLSLFLAVVMDGRGILQISFNLIMASLGSRQTVFSSSFVFIFFFSYLKTKKKRKKEREKSMIFTVQSNSTHLRIDWTIFFIVIDLLLNTRTTIERKKEYKKVFNPLSPGAPVGIEWVTLLSN